ncbi:DUF255 domain-containing protein [Sulfurivermis fontis]|uniref:DUF255 domain-containing protein n=1 Tax=Sulfurivermis fontis TaxID=1972068 RepID=UPI001559E092|nr:DUF255 domain-containing protein [Sulfurivermis fontis]
MLTHSGWVNTGLRLVVAGAALGLLCAIGAVAAVGPGAVGATRPAALQEQLDAVLAARGNNYRPHTRHLSPDGRPRYTNRLILEDSPYLLQHAHNPVDWYPWGEEAFAKARRENKPIFLSIGYSTCHWCHVMARESFEDEAIARLLNENFVAIKLDREQRPDIDHVYMTAVRLITGHGGWPMSSLLTPDGRTFAGGTYFRPADFSAWLVQALAHWRESPEAVRTVAARVAGAVERRLAMEGRSAELNDGTVAAAVGRLLGAHDDLQGGFGSAPKFPREPWLFLLLDHALRQDDARAREAAALSLDAMARGGIHDQVGGGFHRYAVDNDWLVPHFEKMLYNQAQLARLYVMAWRLTGEPGFARVARRSLDYVLRDMTGPEGDFYAATDAESEGEEGRFFLWTEDELRAVLPPDDARFAATVYGVTARGNFQGRTILHLAEAPERLATRFGLTEQALWQRLDRINDLLYRARERRVHPHRDEKVITAWNGQMITALAEAATALDEPRYAAAAARAARSLWRHNRNGDALWRSRVDGRRAVPALLEDYALLAEGVIALYDLDGDPAWLAQARELADAMLERFAHADGSLYMGGEETAAPLMARPREGADGAMPAGNAVALHVLAALWQRTGEETYRERADAILAAFSGAAARQPEVYTSLLIGMNRLRHGDAGAVHYAARGTVRVRSRLHGQRLRLELEIAPGWHINAHQPLQEYLIGTRLTLAGAASAWRLGPIAWPQPKVTRLGFQKEPLAVYEGRLRLDVPLERGETEEGGIAPLELRLQACSDRICLAPETVRLQVPYVEGAGAK